MDGRKDLEGIEERIRKGKEKEVGQRGWTIISLERRKELGRDR